ncbi:MAG: hypothetical protein HYU64_02565 [Armatimonadetes bacterium]|nr:hypothetical protein [Armatimonadota bacterium]
MAQTMDAIKYGPSTGGQEEFIRRDLGLLAEIGRILVATQPPWVSGWQEWGFDLNFFDSSSIGEQSSGIRRSDEPAPELDSDRLFGAFMLLAAMLEPADSPASREGVEHLPKLVRSNQPFFSFYFRLILVARFDNTVPDGKVKDEMEKCGFTSDQRSFIRRWIRREINLIEKAVT